MPPEESLTTVQPLVVPEIVTLPDEIDIYNAALVGHELISALGERTTVLIANMLETEFCDSSGVRHLLIASRSARRRGAELRIVVQSPAVLRVLRTLGVDRMLNIYDTLDAAFSAPHPP